MKAIYLSHLYQTEWSLSSPILLYLLKKDNMLDTTLKFYPENYKSFILGVGEKVLWNGFGSIYSLKTMCLEYEFKDVICFYWVVDLWVWPHWCTPEKHYWWKITHQLYSGKMAMLDYLQLKVTEIYPSSVVYIIKHLTLFN